MVLVHSQRLQQQRQQLQQQLTMRSMMVHSIGVDLVVVPLNRLMVVFVVVAVVNVADGGVFVVNVVKDEYFAGHCWLMMTIKLHLYYLGYHLNY